MSSIPESRFLSRIHEDAETVGFAEICQSHPEMDGTVIQTGVFLTPPSPPKPRMTRVMNSVLKPFSGGHTERRPKYQIRDPNSSVAEPTPPILPLPPYTPSYKPAKLSKKDIRVVPSTPAIRIVPSIPTIRTAPSMPTMRSMPSLARLSMKALPPVPSMPNLRLPAEEDTSVPPVSPLPPVPPVPPVPHLPPLPPLPPRPPTTNAPPQEEEDAERRRIFHKEYVALASLLADYKKKKADADDLLQRAVNSSSEATDRKHEMIAAVGRIQLEYGPLDV